VTPFDAQLRTRIAFGAGSASRAGEFAEELGFRRTLLVSDPGVVKAGHAGLIERTLRNSGVEPLLFTDFASNPDSEMVERGRLCAAAAGVDSIVALGGGSSLDCAKGINFVLTNGGRMEDYLGYGKATKPMLPMIGIPTTAGTGSEAQSYALISDAATHKKMACGDPRAAFRIAILDPELAVSQPFAVRAESGYDAISHAVETWVTTRRNHFSACFSRESWRLIHDHFERTLAAPHDAEAAGAMLLGAHFAGIAIEHSMLGATHACANPLTANYGVAHGRAIAALLPEVVRWNADARYAELHSGLPVRLRELAGAAGLGVRLTEFGVIEADLPRLAGQAAEQWTGRFNPRPFDAAGALEIYRCAF
jgi:alcohol dehydrogenase